jgi:FkbM family methyltransferase
MKQVAEASEGAHTLAGFSDAMQKVHILDTINIQLPGGKLQQFQHRGSPADKGVVQQIFVSEDYSLNRFARGPEMVAQYERMANPLIIDLGANIGASVVYFGLHFPEAHITAIEPDKNNFTLLQSNIKGMNVDCRCVAIGSSPGYLTLIDPGQGEWAYRTVKSGSGIKVPVLAMDTLMKEKRNYEPFICKIDIEGAEDDLFSKNVGWIDAFPVLIIELHDWLLPRAGSSRNFLRAITDRNRDFVYYGENIFSFRN